MEAGTAFALSFPDPSATASSHLLSDGSCPTHSLFHGPSINSVLTFWTTSLGAWNSLTSKSKTIKSNTTSLPTYRSSLQLYTESACGTEWM